MTVVLEELTVADAPEAWRACGFEVVGEECVVGGVRIRFAPRDGARGISGWSLSGIASTDLDGLPTTMSQGQPPGETPEHPNGITGLDHVVAISSDLDRTLAALSAAGFELRRLREEPTPAGAPRQAFFLLGPAILEVVQEPPEVTAEKGDRPAFFWGLAFVAPDLERTVAYLGEERVSAVRDAVQPGRRIATLRRAAGLSVPIALMSPR